MGIQLAWHLPNSRTNSTYYWKGQTPTNYTLIDHQLKMIAKPCGVHHFNVGWCNIIFFLTRYNKTHPYQNLEIIERLAGLQICPQVYRLCLVKKKGVSAAAACCFVQYCPPAAKGHKSTAVADLLYKKDEGVSSQSVMDRKLHFYSSWGTCDKKKKYRYYCL